MAITKATRRPSQNQSPRTKSKGKGSNTSSGSSGGNLYTHSSPPKVLPMNSSNIRQWLKAGDLEKLEDVIIDGQGQKLLKESSADDKTRAFLRSVPDRISKMDAIHKVVEEGDLRQTKNLLDRRKYAMSRDKNGVSLLHKAVMNGRTEVAEYLASNYPEILNLTDAETAVVTLRRSRRPERQMAAYQRHLLRMQKRRSSVAVAGVEAAAAAVAAANADGDSDGAVGGEGATGTTTPQTPAAQKQPGHNARPKVVSHWVKMPGEEEKTGEDKADKDKKAEGGKKEKRKGTARRVSTSKGKKGDVSKKENENSGENQKRKKPKKKVRMSDDAPEVVNPEKTPVSKSKWAGIHAALRLWHREPVPQDQLESVPVSGPGGEERHVTLRRPPPLTVAFEGLPKDAELPSKTAARADEWRALAHASAVGPAQSAQLVASLLSEVVDEESAEILQDELTDELARRLVERVLDRAQLVAYNRYEHAEAVKHIFLSNMGNIVPVEQKK